MLEDAAMRWIVGYTSVRAYTPRRLAEMLTSGDRTVTEEEVEAALRTGPFRQVKGTSTWRHAPPKKSKGKKQHKQKWGRPAQHGGASSKPARDNAKAAPPKRLQALPYMRPVAHPSRRLYVWQQDALGAWVNAGRKGVVEAVTGTGKTLLAAAAISECLCQGGVALVLVPTIDLQRQWVAGLRQELGNAPTIGKLGGNSTASYPSSRIVVAVINSVRDRRLALPQGPALLVADECHHCGAPRNAQALRPEFDRRLALTATLERSDDGVDKVLRPYFGKTVARIGFRRAVGDGVIAHFKVARVGVRFGPDEQREYDDRTRALKRNRMILLSSGVPKEPYGEFMEVVGQLADNKPARSSGPNGRGSVEPTFKTVNAARGYLSAFSARRTLLAEATDKLRRLADISEALRSAERSLVFTNVMATAEAAARTIEDAGVRARAVFGELEPRLRRQYLEDFERGSVKALCAPMILDEGIDVPEADFAVILLGTSTRRQMIQRMGRILRRKADGRLARFVVLYVEGTSEDPALGSHPEFYEEVIRVADEVRSFDASAAPRDIVDFLDDMEPVCPPRPPMVASPLLRPVARKRRARSGNGGSGTKPAGATGRGGSTRARASASRNVSRTLPVVTSMPPRRALRPVEICGACGRPIGPNANCGC